VIDWRTSGAVKGIRGQSYLTFGIWPLCPWDPVTLLRYPSYPTFTGKVILELREVVTGTGYQFRYGFVLCTVSGYEFRRLVCLVSLCYVLF